MRGVATPGHVLLGLSLGTLAVIGSAASAAHLTEPASAPPPSEPTPPSEELDLYLGRRLGPTYWDAFIADELASCLENGGGAAPPSTDVSAREQEWRSTLELQLADPAQFAASYGYGIAVEIRFSDVASSSTGANQSGDVEACRSEVYATVVEPLLPPPEVTGAYNRLMRDFTSSLSYTQAVADWRTCMADLGLEAESTGAELVIDLAYNLADGAPAEGTVSPLELTESELQQLQSYELRVFGQDRDCGMSSGRAQLEEYNDVAILNELRSTFPDFPGVANPS